MDSNELTKDERWKYRQMIFVLKSLYSAILTNPDPEWVRHKIRLALEDVGELKN